MTIQQKYIIKEFCELAETVVIRSRMYTRTGEIFEQYYHTALEDFPELTRADYEIIHYHNGCGIEFKAKNAPETYYRIDSLARTK